MKKIKASIIKRLLRISCYLFLVQFWSSLSILSYFLHFWSTLALEKGRKRKDNEIKGQERKVGSSNFNIRILQVTCCMCNFLAGMWMHGTHMLLLVHFLSLAWVFPSLTTVLAFPCHFLDSHVVMGFILGWALDSRKGLESGEVVSKKSQDFVVEMVFSRNPSQGRWRQENSSRNGEGILRHPSLVWFCDLLTGFGEIAVVWGWRWFNL